MRKLMLSTAFAIMVASPMLAGGDLTYVVNNESATYDPSLSAESFAAPIIGNTFEGLVRTERTSGRYVTEDTALIEQLRADTARTLASDFLEKMRGIGYSPAQAAALLEHWDAKEDLNE